MIQEFQSVAGRRPLAGEFFPQAPEDTAATTLEICCE